MLSDEPVPRGAGFVVHPQQENKAEETDENEKIYAYLACQAWKQSIYGPAPHIMYQTIFD